MRTVMALDAALGLRRRGRDDANAQAPESELGGQVEDAGRQEETADENNYQGSAPAEIFADGFESGDTTAWSSVVQDGKTKGAEATLIIAGPFR